MEACFFENRRRKREEYEDNEHFKKKSFDFLLYLSNIIINSMKKSMRKIVNNLTNETEKCLL